ncbi:MAG: GNAT family N-acetyltransferase [Abyssibacter sp.]|uniref:GNAT family N-acetyltransferase n=1 Tax=Abyssibacter sp. TaxID=2320200 RepID=UPI00321B49AB
MTPNVGLADYQNLAHAQALRDLLAAYAADPMGGGKALEATVLDRVVPALAARAEAFSLLAWSDGQAVGFANCFEGFSTFAARPVVNIHDLAVLPAFRGRGISQALLAAIEQEAHRRNACKLTLEVLSHNHIAQAAYTRWGFKGYALDPSAGHALFWEKPLTSAP